MMRYLLLLAALTGPAMAEDNGPQLWGRIHEVFSHPRCANCHVGPENAPMWSGKSYGSQPRPHGMNINAGPSRIGAEYIACSTCHAPHNSALPHGAPGAATWLLAPVEMQWFGQSSAEICAEIKDPSRNGGRTLAAVAEHIEREPLVQWGWAPGPGREAPPYSAPELAKFIRQWDALGAPCPDK